MSYQVTARKWRPQTFDEIVGQDHVTTTLKNALEGGRTGHAFLFTGIRGVGKTTAARILAKALNCVEGTVATPCNSCQSCEEVTKGFSLDVKEIDGASNRGIDSIRELREGVAFAPARDRFKVYIIDEVHMLTTEAFNALLKTLEEPPEHVIFIFATTELHKVPRTIASRCQVFEFKRITVALIISRLRKITASEGVEITDDALRVIAREADGSLRDASSLLDQVVSFSEDKIETNDVSEILRTGNRDALKTVLGAILNEDPAGAVRVFLEIRDKGMPPRQFLTDLARYLADCMKVDLLGHDAARETGITDAEIGEMASLVGDRQPEYLAVLLDMMVKAADDSADSRSPALLAQAVLVRAANLKGLSSIESMIERLESISTGAGAKSVEPEVAEPKERREAPKTRPLRKRTAEEVARSAPEPAPLPRQDQDSEAQADEVENSIADRKQTDVDSASSSDGDIQDMFRKLPAVDKVLGTFGGDVVKVEKEEK